MKQDDTPGDHFMKRSGLWVPSQTTRLLGYDELTKFQYFNVFARFQCGKHGVDDVIYEQEGPTLTHPRSSTNCSRNFCTRQCLVRRQCVSPPLISTAMKLKQHPVISRFCFNDAGWLEAQHPDAQEDHSKMFRLQPITEQDIIRAMSEPGYRRFPRDEKELAALYNRILEDKLFEALNPHPPRDDRPH